MSWDIENNWTIIAAPNACGKSTIIESIHLLASGDSPWTNKQSCLFRQPPRNTKTNFPQKQPKDSKSQQKHSPNAYEKLMQNNMRIEAELEKDKDYKHLSIALQRSNGTITKQYEIDGNSTTKNKFTENLHTILFSPHMIDLLMFEPRQRRRFLDSQISRVDYTYNDLTTKYGKVRRQRNHLLKNIKKSKYKKSSHNTQKKDAKQRHKNNNNSPKNQKNSFKFWTEQLIDLGSKIIKKRIDFIEQINTALAETYETKLHYIPKVNISELEKLASEKYIADSFRQQLRGVYKKECAIGTTIVGPHRDDWNLQSQTDVNLNLYGSRGEKRMAIADIMFKINNYLIDQIAYKPIILLDDIASELDSDNIKVIFEKKIDPNQQAIITTTNLDLIPSSTKKSSQIIKLET
jgi:DNA replication and repair protein RecF